MGIKTDYKITLLDKIETALNAIRPFLHKDGGDIEVVEITDDMTLRVRLLGNCETCPMNMSTMKAGVEESVRSAIPEIRAVVAVE